MVTKTLIRGGKVIDGTGSSPLQRNVLIAGPFIAQILEADSVTPKDAEVLDATGLYVCPGFIDIHTHSDVALFEDPGAETTLAQGITTIVVGNCGFSSMPIPDNKAALAEDFFGALAEPGQKALSMF